MFNHNAEYLVERDVKEERAPPCDAAEVCEINPHLGKHPVSGIINGLCENLKNIREYRMLIRQEIEDILRKRWKY